VLDFPLRAAAAHKLYGDGLEEIPSLEGRAIKGASIEAARLYGPKFVGAGILVDPEQRPDNGGGHIAASSGKPSVAICKSQTVDIARDLSAFHIPVPSCSAESSKRDAFASPDIFFTFRGLQKSLARRVIVQR
jgi:hypothetical protein